MIKFALFGAEKCLKLHFSAPNNVKQEQIYV